MTHEQMLAVHDHSSIESYRNWRSQAPASWTSNKWFMTRVPLMVASRYGQNEPLEFTESTADHFHGQLRWKDMRWISFALATQLEWV